MSNPIRTARAIAAAACLSALAACGAASPSTESGAGTASTAVNSTATPAQGYTPVSDVSSHAAIGDDFAAIKKQLSNAKDTKPVDWAAVKTTFSAGGASKKSDGGTRTLAGLVKAPDVVAYITTAIDGGDGSDAVRAQRVEKGITALLYLKVLDEIEVAKTKVAEAKTDPKEGAPHNVDEAWAFYTANGNGLQSTAQKRGDDFKKPVDQTVLAALTATLSTPPLSRSCSFTESSGSVTLTV